MASSIDFVNFVIDQMQEAGNMHFKKMFGEYGIYCNEVFVGCICDNQCFLKVTEPGVSLIKCPVYKPAYEGAKPSLLIENLEDRAFLGQLVKVTSEALAKSPSKKKKTPQKRDSKVADSAAKEKKDKLSSLPNIGKVVEEQLNRVGIEDIGTLKKVGSKEAWLRIQKIDESACYNRLCALEGALEGVRWHDLSAEMKGELKAFYEAHRL